MTVIKIAVTPVRPDCSAVPSVSSDIDRAASKPQKMKTATRKPPSSALKEVMAKGLNHSHENGCAVALRSLRKMLIASIAANNSSPPYWMTVRMIVVREDSSAPRATSHVVMKMNPAAINTFSQSGESSIPNAEVAALTVIPAAPTPARMLDSMSANPPIQPMCGRIALEPQVNTVPASGAASVRCL